MLDLLLLRPSPSSPHRSLLITLFSYFASAGLYHDEHIALGVCSRSVFMVCSALRAHGFLSASPVRFQPRWATLRILLSPLPILFPLTGALGLWGLTSHVSRSPPLRSSSEFFGHWSTICPASDYGQRSVPPPTAAVAVRFIHDKIRTVNCLQL
jgi:hypothetical protein